MRVGGRGGGRVRKRKSEDRADRGGVGTNMKANWKACGREKSGVCIS